MHAVNRIFRYLKGQPTLGLWYSKDSPLELIAYLDSDYAGATLDRKSTTSCCQFLGIELKGYLLNYGYADLVQHAEVLMIEYVRIVEIDMVSHATKTNMMKLVVEIKCVGMSADAINKETRSSDGLQPEQADLNCVYALNEPHLHEIHVVPSKHEADQHVQLPYQFDVDHKFAPFRRKSVQKLCVYLKLFQFHVVYVHVIEE
nr:uncharacterized mitochondrial protein AtMg00810-like [Tanacetum cinerariifolium]